MTAPNARPRLNPPVGISHVAHSVEDLYARRLKPGQKLVFHPAAQLNSYPHLGTVTTLAATFALAERLRDKLGTQSQILFWALENAPGEYVEVPEGTFYRSLALTPTSEDGLFKAEKYFASFQFLLASLSGLTGVPYQVKTYRDFQSEPRVRELTISLVQQEECLAPLLCPSEARFKVRFACPRCGFAAKQGATLSHAAPSYPSLSYVSECFEHGSYNNTLSPHSPDLFDINTPARAITREALAIEEAGRLGSENMMSDGADWNHYAVLNVEALHHMGYAMSQMPLRFFSPVILDWSGAKLSKSAQVGSTAYEGTPQYFVNLEALREAFGDHIVEVLLRQAQEWLDDPKKVFRNYTLDYMQRVLDTAAEARGQQS